MPTTTTAARADVERTYDAFAGFYDSFTAGSEYDHWTAELERLARPHGLTGDSLLDAGCGTGRSTRPFVDRGYRAVGCDVSRRMLALAGDRLGAAVPLHHADLRALPVLGPFDLVTCLDDVLNYLDDFEELVAALTGLRDNLSASGVLIFDLNELGTYRSFFARTLVVEDEGSVVVWRGRGSPTTAPGARVGADVEAFAQQADGRYTRTRVHHGQRHFPEPEVRAALAAAGLRCAAVHGQDAHASFHPGVEPELDTKAVYIALPDGAG